MTLNREDAEQALAEIGEARGRFYRAQGYGDFAPFLILWGVIWLVANSVADLAPQYVALAWGIGNIGGIAISMILGVRLVARWRARGESKASRPIGLRIGLSWSVAVAAFVCIGVIVGPLDGRQANAAISIFWAFVYMGAGIWIGWRLAAIGVVIAATVLGAYLLLEQYYFLAIGLVAGGGLILGGLWLRRI